MKTPGITKVGSRSPKGEKIGKWVELVEFDDFTYEPETNAVKAYWKRLG